MSVHISPAHHARPLTPPHDIDGEIESALQFLTEDTSTSHITPPNSSPLRSPNRQSKRVDFHLVPTVLATPGRRYDRLRTQPKSILKTSSPLPTPDDCSTTTYFQYQPGINMLESAVQHLNSAARDARLDAYLAINGALIAYDDLPSVDQWKLHLAALQQHVLRDIKLRDTHDSLATNIVIQAIKLVAYMANEEQVLKLLDYDFHSSVLDRIVAALGDSSKQIMKTALGFLSQQRLDSSVFTSSRMDRMLLALDKLDQKSRGVVLARLMILRRLVDQAPSHMLAQISLWLPHMLNGMMSDMSETRQRAIDLGMHVALVFGQRPRPTEVLHSLFETGDDPNYFEHFALSLAKMISTDANLQVPQIWTVIVLFHRCPKSPIYLWRRLGAWLKVLQSCLNYPDPFVRQKAHIAWRKLAYVSQPTAATPKQFSILLKQPIRLGFSKFGADQSAKQSRQHALDSFYNLLHYALQPRSSHADLDNAWETFVIDLLRPMISASSKGREVACATISGLLTPNTGSWNADAALEDTAILPQDLPRLDPRWIRSRMGRVLTVVEPILQHAMTGSDSAYSSAQQMLINLLKTVSDASGQEVKTSSDSKAALAALLSTFRRLWLAAEDESVQRLSNMIDFTLQQSSVLMDDFLYVDALGNVSLQPHHTTPFSPLVYLLSFTHASGLSLLSLGKILQSVVPSDLQWLKPTWEGLMSSSLDYDKEASWSVLADLTILGLNLNIDSAKIGTTLLLDGVKELRSSSRSALLRLTTALCSTIADAGPDANITLLVDPFSKACLESSSIAVCHKELWDCTDVLLSSAKWPSVSAWISSQHPFLHLAELLGHFSRTWYAEPPWQDVADLLTHTTALIKHAGPWGTTIYTFADVFTPWLQDADRRIDTSDKAAVIVDVLKTIMADHAHESLQPLLIASLSSTVPIVVEVAISYWNAQNITPTSDIADLLRTLATVRPVNLHNLVAENLLDLPYLEHVSRVTASEAEAQSTHPEHTARALYGKSSVVANTSIPHRTPQICSNSELDTHTPTATRKRSASARDDKKKRKRPRHNDSQIEFVPIAPVQLAESQHLTEHQIDIEEAQRLAVAQFPEFSSSPPQTSPASSHDSPSQARRLRRKEKRRRRREAEDAEAQIQQEAALSQSSQKSQRELQDLGEEIVVLSNHASQEARRTRPFEETDLLGRLRQVLVEMDAVSINKADEKKLDDLLFDLRCAVHSAARAARSR